MADPATPLQDRLDAITARTRTLVQPERLAPSERAVEELFASGIESRVLPVGSVAPSFSLCDGAGRIIHSADLLALGPLILKIFRGRWCSYCVNELEAWRDLYSEVRARGALLAALSPQTVRQNDFTVQQHGLPFPVLADPEATMAEKFGVAYTVSEPLRRYYHSILVNLPFMNGDRGYRLPLPATFVIGRDSRILYARAYADFRVRPEPEEVLAALPVARSGRPGSSER